MQSNRILLAVGAALALVLGAILAFVLSRGHKPSEPPPASQSTGLQISVNDTPAIDATKKLRCFKDGAPVGDYTLAECARLNGVSAQALDVGPDASGALSAVPTASLAPPPVLPPAQPAPTQSAGPVATGPAAVTTSPQPASQAVAQGHGAQCLRHTGSEWRQISDGMTLNACVQALYAGRCAKPGEAIYGRFGDQTLRLVLGKVEISNDNSHFRTLVEQRHGCEIPQAR
ncbi:MAG: hypothetical protein JSR45_15550 [Proteobacteria bacterium]|nr:hypothetical protein [Pseudomonadota bacterium]